jgi:excisionase family DNA binding protein
LKYENEGTASKRKEMISLRQAGLTYNDIGAKVGVSRERVRQVLTGSKKRQSSESGAERTASLLRTGDVARLLGIHTNTVRRWANDGSLKSYRVGKRGDRRFRRGDVERALSDRE